MQDRVRWMCFLGGVATFVVGVELWHMHVKDMDSVYQCRILIDKDFSIEEAGPEEEVKSENISLYTRTNYGILPRKQSDPTKIFDAYSANVSYITERDISKEQSEKSTDNDTKNKEKNAENKTQEENDNKYIKLAIVVQDATKESVQNIINEFGEQKVSFIIPYYVSDLNDIAEAIISSGNEFFLQLPTQTSIPTDKKESVSPFLANASEDEVREKLNYLVASVKYAIGVANTSESLITKSRKDMSIIARELSQRGMAFLNIKDDSEVLEDVSTRIRLLSLRADLFNKDNIKEKRSIIIKSEQLNDLKEALPKGMKVVPVSFGRNGK